MQLNNSKYTKQNLPFVCPIVKSRFFVYLMLTALVGRTNIVETSSGVGVC